LPTSNRERQRQASTSIAREAKDILLKHLAAGLGGGFLASLGIELSPIVDALPADVPVLEVRVEQPDSLYRLADGAILHFEFQMTSDVADLRRFYRYNYAASEYYDSSVHTVVFYGPRVLEAPDIMLRGSITYVVRNIYVGRQDGEAVLGELREKLTRGESLGDVDLTRFKLLPLMAQSRPLTSVLVDAAELAGALVPALRDEVIGTMLGLAYNYLGQDIVDRLLGVNRDGERIAEACGRRHYPRPGGRKGRGSRRRPSRGQTRGLTGDSIGPFWTSGSKPSGPYHLNSRSSAITSTGDRCRYRLVARRLYEDS
jgi:hypothetical protein